jgi:uncharacterized protein (DUF2164 family)
MPIELSSDRRIRLTLELQRFYGKEFDEELSPFRSDKLIEFFLGALGPHVYNQAVQDARAFMLRKLEDLDGEVYAGDAGQACGRSPRT